MTIDKYANRREAGKSVATYLKAYAKHPGVQVLALPRGGVPVAYEIAKALSAPLDILIIRKLGVPGHEELAFGAIAGGGVIVFNEALLKTLSLSEQDIHRVIQVEQEELQRRETTYRGNKPFPTLKNKVVILVDDGIATGATMRAAIQALKQQQPKRLIVAVPVAARSTIDELSPLVDEIICPLQPEAFYAVGAWYQAFPQTTDEEVLGLLQSGEIPAKSARG